MIEHFSMFSMFGTTTFCTKTKHDQAVHLGWPGAPSNEVCPSGTFCTVYLGTIPLDILNTDPKISPSFASSQRPLFLELLNLARPDCHLR